MTRKEAIYRLKNMAWLYGSTEREQNIEAIDMAIEVLSDGIEWISCSKRLPRDSGNYLIAVADLRLGHIGEHTITIADFYAKAKKWNSVVDVIAWMPLPTPYKGGDSE